MKKKTKFILLIYFIVLGVMLFNAGDLTKLANNLDYVACGTATKIPKPFPQLTTVAYTLLITATPLVLIVFSIITLVKAIMSGNIEDVTKAKGKLLKKVIIAVIIFLVAGLVQYVLNRVTTNDDDKSSMATCMKCFLYFNDKDCPKVEYDGITKSGTYHRTYSNQAQPVSTSNKSNGNNSNSTTPSYGDFSGKQIHDAALFMVKYEGGIDSNGQPKYGNFGQCYELSSSETGITIGAGGWMGASAATLLKEIQRKYPETFKKLDTGGNIANDLKSANWMNYCVARGSAKANTIISIITSEDGKKVQDEMIEKNVTDYIKECESKGIKDKRSMFLYMNVRHVFGPGGVQDLLNASKPDYKFDVMSSKVLSISKYNGMTGWTNRWKAAIEYAKKNL